MPNIEAYGISNVSGITATIGASDLPEEFRKEIVITKIESSCWSTYDGISQPFIRICSTDEKDIDMIAKKVLQPLRYDIETLVLTGFYPGKK